MGQGGKRRKKERDQKEEEKEEGKLRYEMKLDKDSGVKIPRARTSTSILYSKILILRSMISFK